MNYNLNDDFFTKVSLDDYDIIKTIGAGAYGRVYLIKSKDTNKIYALKSLKKAKVINSNQIEHTYSELSILQEIKHQNTISLHSFIQDQQYLHFIIDYIPGGELFTLLRSEGKFEVDNAKFYIGQLIQALTYLHSKNIIYRDLKPENILFDSEGYIKLTDFGTAKKIEGKTYTLFGTPNYLAPEVVLKQGYHFPADWWSLGVLTYEMVVGIDPWNENDPMMIYQKIIQGKVFFPKNMNKDLKSFIQHLMIGDPSKRLGSHMTNNHCDIYDHSWYNKYDWDSLINRTAIPWHIPKIKGEDDTSNYNDYSDSESDTENIDKGEDPFLDW